MKQTLEQELKLAADAAFELPDLPGEPIAERVFTSTYHDTGDGRLASLGVTLRRRVENGRSLWQLKLPQESARLELEVPGGPAGPPEPLDDIVRNLLHGSPLEPVAELRTRRRGVHVVESGAPVADVTIDLVDVLDALRVERSFTEVEVELTGGRPRDLTRLGKLLRKAGAAPSDGRPKLFQALGLEAADGDGAAHPLAQGLRTHYLALLAHAPGTRLGDNAEELHQMRVSTRRLRAFMRAGRPLLDREQTDPVRDELKWLGGELGPVRDLDVLLEHLRAEVAQLDPRDSESAGALLIMLDAERDAARDELVGALASDRYRALLERLDDFVRTPPLLDGGPTVSELAAKEFRRLRKAVRALGKDPPDDELHAVRVNGKRARYAGELAEPEAGKKAGAFVKAAKAFQDVLGDHQDAAVAEERLRELLPKTPDTALAVGRLVERERARKAAARAAFPAAWASLERAGKAAWT